METAAMMPSIMSGSLMRAIPPWARMSAGTRSSAITATAPASSAILACSGVTTSMMTPPLSCSAMPRFTRWVPVEEVLSYWSDCGDTECCLWIDGRSSNAPSYGRSGGGPTGSPDGGRMQLQAVVDVEVAGLGPGAVQPHQAGQPAATQFTGVAHRVVVEAPGQRDPRAGPPQVAL